MKKLNRISYLFIVPILLGVGIAAPALAAPPAGYVSLFDDVAYQGAAYPIAQAWTGCRNIPPWFNDKASSVSNQTAYGFHFYKDGNCSGTMYTIYAHTQDSSLGSDQGNNTWSSYARF